MTRQARYRSTLGDLQARDPALLDSDDKQQRRNARRTLPPLVS
jgi:hypothetical protein